MANFKHLWGQGVEEPLIAIENVKVTKEQLTLMARDRNPTLKITLPNGMSLIKFRSSDEEYTIKVAYAVRSRNDVGVTDEGIYASALDDLREL